MDLRVCVGLSAECIEAVKSYYEKDEISWQTPGQKDRIITREVSANGESSKTTLQVRYMLMSLKEAYHGFVEAFPSLYIGLTKFCELRPANIKLFDQIPHNVCVCAHHENMRLILTVLEHFTKLSSKYNEFVNQVTCWKFSKDCIYRRCGDCKNLLETFKPSPEDGDTLTKYQQWQSLKKKSEKVTITATVNAVFNDLRAN